MMPGDYVALTEAARQQIFHEAAAGWGSVVDRTEYLYDDSSFGYSRSLPFTSADDRKGGAFRPVYYTEQDLASIRAQVRNLWEVTPIPNGVVETLANYTFGTGIGYTVQSDVDNPQLMTAIQKTIDRFVKDHGLDGDMDREIHRRTREDGEAFVRLRWIDGRVNAQFVEPDVITEPGNPLSVEEYCGLEAGGCWRFGVHTDSDDTSNVRGYYAYWGESDRDWEYIPECRMGHFKRNVTAAAKRGFSDFYGIISDLYNEARLTGNATSGAALQAAIAWIRQTPAGTTSSQAATLGGTSPVRQASRPVAGGGTSLSNVGRYAPNTVLTVPAGQEYKPGPLGAERNAGFDLIGQRVLKRCGVRWSMPEGMISGDASNNNYASALVAQSPFTKGRQADQVWYGKRTIALLWKVIRLAWEHGRFDRYGVSIEQMMEHCDITASYPTVESMDKLEQVQVQKAQRELGILSLTTAAKQAGYDLEEEQRLGAKAPEPAPQMMPSQMPPAMLAQQAKLAGQVPASAVEPDATEPAASWDSMTESLSEAAGSDERWVTINGHAVLIKGGKVAAADMARIGKPAASPKAPTSKPTPSPSNVTKPGQNFESSGDMRRVRMAANEANLNDWERSGAGVDSLFDKKKLPKETGQGIDAHGTATLENLTDMLSNGIDKKRQFYSEPLSGGEGLLKSNSPFVVLGQPGKSIVDGGIGAVIVDGHHTSSIPLLQKHFPNVKFIPAAEANARIPKLGKLPPVTYNTKESIQVPESAFECGHDMRQAVAIALESVGTTAEARAILEQLNV